jgi:hypothetical protein
MVQHHSACGGRKREKVIAGYLPEKEYTRQRHRECNDHFQHLPHHNWTETKGNTPPLKRECKPPPQELNWIGVTKKIIIKGHLLWLWLWLWAPAQDILIEEEVDIIIDIDIDIIHRSPKAKADADQWEACFARFISRLINSMLFKQQCYGIMLGTAA